MAQGRIPDGSHMILVMRQWVIVEKGRSYLLQEAQIASGDHVGEEVRIKTPITDVTGTVEFS